MTKTQTIFESFKAEAGDLLKQPSPLADQLNGMVKIQRTKRDAMRGMPAEMDGQFVSGVDLKAFRDDDKRFQRVAGWKIDEEWDDLEWTECSTCGWVAARESGDGDFNSILDDEFGSDWFLCDPCCAADDRCRDTTFPPREKPSKLDKIVSDRLTDVLEKFGIFRNDCE